MSNSWLSEHEKILNKFINGLVLVFMVERFIKPSQWILTRRELFEGFYSDQRSRQGLEAFDSMNGGNQWRCQGGQKFSYNSKITRMKLKSAQN